MDNEWTEYKDIELNNTDYLLDIITDHKIVYFDKSLDGSSMYLTNSRLVPFWIKKESHITRPLTYIDLLEISVVYTHQQIEIEGE